jgi:hypothetical protein
VYLATDSFYFVRAPTVIVDTSGHEPGERRFLTGHRWWTLAELRATRERVLPIGLADLMTQLLVGDPPREPVRLPWRTVDPPTHPERRVISPAHIQHQPDRRDRPDGQH